MTDGWRPHPGFQTRFLSHGAYEVLGGGAAGPGKTDCLIAACAGYATNPFHRGLFLRTEFTDLKDILDRMHALYPQLGATYKTADRRWQWPSGATTEMGYGKNIAQMSRYFGRQFTDLMFDEVGLLEEEEAYLRLLSRIRAPKLQNVKLHVRLSANPGGAGHFWLKARFIEPCGRQGERVVRSPKTGLTRAYVPGIAIDNPSLDESYWDKLKDLPPALVKALREGDWDAGLGMFYPEISGQSVREKWFVQRSELPAELPGWWDFWSSYDWGFRHPAVFSAYARDENARIFVLDTLYMHRTNDEAQGANIKGMGQRTNHRIPQEVFTRCYAGRDAWTFRQAHSATPETVADIMDKYGIYMTPASLDRDSGSRSVRRAFQTDGIRFVDTPGNRRLADELGALVPDPNRPETPLKRDADADTGLGGDDGPDNLRYGIATVPFVPHQPKPKEVTSNVSDGKDPEHRLQGAPTPEVTVIFRREDQTQQRDDTVLHGYEGF